MQKVLITAGATGIGYALAKQFSDAGYQIWIIDISKKALKECPKDWERSNIDVCDENAMSSLFKKINDKKFYLINIANNKTHNKICRSGA